MSCYQLTWKTLRWMGHQVTDGSEFYGYGEEGYDKMVARAIKEMDGATERLGEVALSDSHGLYRTSGCQFSILGGDETFNHFRTWALLTEDHTALQKAWDAHVARFPAPPCESCSKPIPPRELVSYASDANGAGGFPRFHDDCA